MNHRFMQGFIIESKNQKQKFLMLVIFLKRYQEIPNVLAN